MFDSPHRRYNPLTQEWVLVSPHRAKRPWQGQVNKVPEAFLPVYDPSCYLCPGNERAGGIKNPEYTGTFVFTNDFAALLPESGGDSEDHHPLFTAVSETGICKVICFSPRHDLTLPQLSPQEAEQVINTWSRETEELFKNPNIAYVQVFENKGALMGCSNPHPHSQIWSQSIVPNEPAKELISQKAYFQEHGTALLLDYLAEEQMRVERILFSNDHFTALVPFWAIWPFEVMVVAHRQVATLFELSPAERRDLADIFQQVTIAYDNLFEISFPYSMGFHQSPNDKQEHPEWVLHAHFYPPLLRSATVKKFMVGYELMAMPQRDITAETAAARLRELPKIHYTKR
jgi:UDPglucose--hexose-1-phosphate uridylyltransferase